MNLELCPPEAGVLCTMKKAYFRFYEELNDFLPEEKRKIRFAYDFTGIPSVKDIIEALGVPHTEVDLILVNGISVNFSFRINDNDDISVYPVFETFDITLVQHLRPEPLRNPAFILDVHLGSLAKYMRMTGLDAFYNNSYNADEIVDISLRQNRAILTSDRKILKRNDVTHGYWVRNKNTTEQLREIIMHFHLEGKLNPFIRCIMCNQLLLEIKKEEVINEIPPKVNLWAEEFKKCPACGKVYWKGSHYSRMKEFIDEFKKSL